MIPTKMMRAKTKTALVNYHLVESGRLHLSQVRQFRGLKRSLKVRIETHFHEADIDHLLSDRRPKSRGGIRRRNRKRTYLEVNPVILVDCNALISSRHIASNVGLY